MMICGTFYKYNDKCQLSIEIDKKNFILEINANIRIVVPGVVVVATAAAGVGSVVVVAGVVVSVICNIKYLLPLYYF